MGEEQRYMIKLDVGDEATGIHEETTATQSVILDKYATRIAGLSIDWNLKPGERKPVLYAVDGKAKACGTIGLA